MMAAFWQASDVALGLLEHVITILTGAFDQMQLFMTLLADRLYGWPVGILPPAEVG
jgi:hypothetical protein